MTWTVIVIAIMLISKVRAAAKPKRSHLHNAPSPVDRSH
jgi:hypothetical protein